MSIRKLAVMLVMEIDDEAILCKDDPEMDQIVIAEGGEGIYLHNYLKDNFKGMDWDNIKAFTEEVLDVSVSILD